MSSRDEEFGVEVAELTAKYKDLSPSVCMVQLMLVMSVLAEYVQGEKPTVVEMKGLLSPIWYALVERGCLEPSTNAEERASARQKWAHVVSAIRGTEKLFALASRSDAGAAARIHGEVSDALGALAVEFAEGAA